ncbi:MAG: RNA polymerase sigma factor [Planctomycetota bacterium]
MPRPSQSWTKPDQDLELVRGVLLGTAADRARFLDRMEVIRHIVGRLNRGQRHPLEHETVEDLEQTIFAAIWKQLPTFRGDCQLSTWVFRIVFNLFQLEVRKRSRRQVVAVVGSDVLELAEMKAAVDAPSAQVEREDELNRVLLLCEQSLNDHQREVVYAHLMEGIGYAELAARTGRPQSSLRSDLSRALQIIREKLGRGCDA